MMSTSSLIFSTFCFGICIATVKLDEGTDCKTPNGETAKCVSIYSCKLFLDALRTNETEVIKFLRESQCGQNKVPLVCCGTAARYDKLISTNVSVNQSAMETKSKTAIADEDSCGFMAEDRIIRGRIADIDDYTWMALLQYKIKTSEKHTFLCAGSLIGPKYVVTAAHCVQGRIQENQTLTSVRLGEWNIDTAQDCVGFNSFQDCSDPPINIDIEEIIVHPEYNDNSIHKYNDIALLRLTHSVNYTDFINPICLPTSEYESIFPRFHIAGWGKTTTSSHSNKKLQLTVPKFSMEDCKKMFNKSNINIEDGQICTDEEGYKDSCTSDGGGPLMMIHKNVQFYLEGLMSFGGSCGKDKLPGVYTKISKYVDWIQRNVRD